MSVPLKLLVLSEKTDVALCVVPFAAWDLCEICGRIARLGRSNPVATLTIFQRNGL